MTTVQNVPGAEFNGRGPIEHVKHQYRMFNKLGPKNEKRDLRRIPALWKDFPIAFRRWIAPEPTQYRGRWRDRMVELTEVTKRLTFVARLDELETSARAYSGYWNQYQNGHAILLHKFIAPFGPMNEALLLETAFPLFMRGDEASIILDEAMENGFKHGADFERIKVSNYVRIESDAFRLFLSENAHKWPPFDLVFEVGMWMGCAFHFNIETWPQPSK